MTFPKLHSLVQQRAQECHAEKIYQNDRIPDVIGRYHGAKRIEDPSGVIVE
jgi:hypothetical protein